MSAHPDRRKTASAYVGRYLTNSEFVVLVSKAWVGTTIRQSQTLAPLIRSVLATVSIGTQSACNITTK